mgnify:CR=1 FL=1
MNSSISDISIIKERAYNCYSVLYSVSISEYIELVEQAYKNRGGIEKQRAALTTTTAKRIRQRMVEDIVKGTVLPPIVLGIREEVTSELDKDKFIEIITGIDRSKVSIIDGMQRTTALIEAAQLGEIGSDLVRVEAWITPSTNFMMYRMLVLNTGQIPWSLRKQLETVFYGFIEEITKRIRGIEIFQEEERRRRVGAGQYQADDVIEMFISFATRKSNTDVNEYLADAFTKLDLIDATSSEEFTNIFCETLSMLSAIDKSFGRSNERSEGKIPTGKDIFSSHPARIGFITAASREIFGRPGLNKPGEPIERASKIKMQVEIFIEKLESMEQDGLSYFLDLGTLNELLKKPSGKIGDFERAFFFEAFKTLFEVGFILDIMTPCWRAH